MRFGTGSVTKLTTAVPRRVAPVLLAPAARSRGARHLRRPPAGVRAAVRAPPGVRRSYALDRVGSAKPGSLAAPLLTLTERLARRGIVIVISDFYDEPDRVAQAVRPLRFRGHDVAVFHVLDPAEIDFPFDEAASFEDLESGDRMPSCPRRSGVSTAPSCRRTSRTWPPVHRQPDRLRALQHVGPARPRALSLPRHARADEAGAVMPFLAPALLAALRGDRHPDRGAPRAARSPARGRVPVR